MSRDLDISIAAALGHYIEKFYGEDNSLRGIYNDNGSPELGGSLAATIFKAGVLEKHRIDDEGYPCWWESECRPNVWYTGAVPLYSSDLTSAFDLLYNHIGNSKFIVETTWIDDDIKKYVCTILIDVTDDGELIAADSDFEDTVELAIAKAFLRYKNMTTSLDFVDYPDDLEPI